MGAHLNFFKWKESALSTEQLKSGRWLLGATRKNAPEPLKNILVMKPRGQENFMTLQIRAFEKAGRRLRASARTRLRLNASEFDKLADYACLMDSVREAARLFTSEPAVDAALLSAFYAK